MPPMPGSPPSHDAGFAQGSSLLSVVRDGNPFGLLFSELWHPASPNAIADIKTVIIHFIYIPCPKMREPSQCISEGSAKSIGFSK